MSGLAVFLVQTNDYDDQHIWGIFSTEEAARSCLARIRAIPSDDVEYWDRLQDDIGIYRYPLDRDEIELASKHYLGTLVEWSVGEPLPPIEDDE